ncbi:Cyclic di-GMP phosphodiesterase Gmr [Marinomonas aquimarina]|uniref:Cyclic di-GMP phosphodiesterase Gmr n=1 Tax=Marinomonas aquimarina TaxID=295068 RepID=A0A1A8TIZ8_9GAMM|nr:EAL domain-containing protein [Marinomonas aquimarina]SBS32479.1 Cyclic di-GMP phosphodiesterase Gmr [Marinomonas aquimarina]
MHSFNTLNLDSLQTPIWIYDVLNYQIYWANSAALALWESNDLDELCRRDLKTGSSEAVQQTLLGYLQDCEAGRSVECWWRISPKGIDKQVFLKYTGIQIPGGRTAMLIEATHSELLNHSVGEAGKSIILGLFDSEGELLSYNPPFKDQFGSYIHNFSDLFSNMQPLAEFINPTQRQRETDQLLKTNHGEKWHRLELNQDPHSGRVICTLTDIHERKLSEIKHAQASITDSLTGLLNRRGLMEQLKRLTFRPHSLYYIDLDGFKPINDSYGHAVGDALLIKVANLLRKEIHDNVIVARLGGDEFILIIPEPIVQAERDQIAETLVARLSAPMQVDEVHRTLISASIGVAHYPNGEDNAERILVCADAAMYMAKRQGRNRYVSYRAGMEEQLLKRSLIVQSLEQAISNDELNLHYQIIHCQRAKRTVAAEALLRWQHPILGSLSPLEIITAAEETGRIASLENWIIKQACVDLKHLQQMYGAECRISINISGAHLSQANFIDDLFQVLHDTQTRSQDIILELTENVLVNSLESGQSTLQKMHELGFAIAIDDFGTGYSSLAYLSQLPASIVKVDKAFIDNIVRNTHTVRFIRDLCQNLNMECLVEGVESQEQVAVLDQLGIGYRQGYFYAKPQPLNHFSTECEPAY